MKRITRAGGSYWMLVGLGLLLVGLPIAANFLASQSWPIDIGESAILAGTPLVLGAILMCVRTGVLVDRQQGTFTRWLGVLVPLFIFRVRHPFSRTRDVVLSYNIRAGQRGGRHLFYTVILDGAGAIVLHEVRSHDKARRLAEELAKFLRVGVRDRSDGDEVVREAGTLDLSLRERMRRAGRTALLPAQPPGGRAILSYGGTRASTTIEIPPKPIGVCLRWFLIGMAIAGAMAMVFELVVRLDGGNLAFGSATRWIMLTVLAVLLPLLIRAAILRERLVVSADEIIFTRRDFFGTRTIRLAGTEIEEVALFQVGYEKAYGKGGDNRVVIRSDRRSIVLGEEISIPQELRWLRDTLVHLLTATLK